MIYAVLLAALLVRPQGSSFLFVSVATLFNIAFGNLDGSLYFLAAATCDFIVLWLLFRFGKSRKALDIMAVSLVSLSLNLLGFVMWYSYEPPDMYVTLFGILYTAATVVILREDGADVGGTSIHINRTGHHSDALASGGLVSQSKEAL